MEFFQYGEKELSYLKGKDKRLAAVIDRLGIVKREVYPDLFAALVNSIVGQQVSMKAQQTVWARVCALLGSVTPEAADECPPQKLRECGMSERKVRYIKNAARAVCSGEFDIDTLSAKSDEDVCSALVALDGVGVWTAEMLMLFSMQRSDVFSWGDLGIKKGLRMLYRHKEITRERFERYRRRYSPYGSVVSLYLWEIAGGALPELTDPQKGK